VGRRGVAKGRVNYLESSDEEEEEEEQEEVKPKVVARGKKKEPSVSVGSFAVGTVHTWIMATCRLNGRLRVAPTYHSIVD
jgi:hypothetical protein